MFIGKKTNIAKYLHVDSIKTSRSKKLSFQQDFSSDSEHGLINNKKI